MVRREGRFIMEGAILDNKGDVHLLTSVLFTDSCHQQVPPQLAAMATMRPPTTSRQSHSTPAPVGCVQGNIPESQKWKTEWYGSSYIKLAQKLIAYLAEPGTCSGRPDFYKKARTTGNW